MRRDAAPILSAISAARSSPSELMAIVSDAALGELGSQALEFLR